jgi:Tol biopolymer transport system component
VTPPQTIAHYRMIAKIGEGGMGEVYRALDTKLGREVAIKIIPETFARDADRMMRFARESRVLASLNHPHIAAIYGVEERALVMELVEGPTLAERIAQGPIPLEEALPIARQIAEALEYAHEKGVVHRDLKPANVKLTADGQAKVLDFGLAKALANDPVAGDPADSPTLTMRATVAGVIMGTAAYMSPEQARGAVADRRADIWSFGVMLYEMLTGRQIFGGETVSDTLAAVLRAELDWAALPPSTPAPIRRLLRRCLERDRKKRLRDIGDAIVEIDEALAGVSEPSAAAPLARSSLGWLIAAISLIALAGLAMAVMHFRETPPPPVPMRFQILAPDKASFGNSGPVLSPDGHRLAFIASGPDGQRMVWVRPLDSLAARALPGTEGATFALFWSPDSRFIGFLAQGLKKIEASGGPPQKLCEITGITAGGSWSRDGVIIVGRPSSGLLSVPQAGGVATQLTKPDASLGEIGHLMPWFLPDGRHFLYVARTEKVEDEAIYLATLDGKERKRLVGARQAAAYAPPAAGSENGHLLFLREGTLLAQSLDARRFELAGEPFPVAEQVGSYLSSGFFSVSANGALAYRSAPSSNSQLTWFDRGGKSLGTLGSPADYFGGLALSPDGKRVAVSEMDQAGKTAIWLLEARGVHTRFTFDMQSEMPTWSPDGTRLVFYSTRDGSGNIYQKDSSGSGNEELLSKSGSPADWSPDGRYLLYNFLDLKTNHRDLWVLPDPAGPPENHKPMPYLRTPFDKRQAQFSPDGHWIAYASDESGPGQYQIYVQSFPAGAGKFQVSTGAGGTQPRWRRDGKEIFYLAANGKLMAVEAQTAPRFEAKAPQALFDPRIPRNRLPPWVDFGYDVTADGKRFLVNSDPTAPESSASAPITVMVNWLAALKR